MKGLLIKDLICIKKQLIFYAFIIVGVITVSIMFVLSYRFGNLHNSFEEMVRSGQNDQKFVVDIANIALMLFMLLPMACTGDISCLFVEDANASFYKVASTFPISVEKRVASRFVTGIAIIGIGFCIDIIMTIVLSCLTDIVSLGEFMGMLVSFASLMLIYICMYMAIMFFGGKGSSSYAGIIPVFMGVILFVISNFNKLQSVLVDDDDEALLAMYNGIIDFVEHKSYIFLLIGIMTLVACYTFSVYIAKRKRGVA